MPQTIDKPASPAGEAEQRVPWTRLAVIGDSIAAGVGDDVAGYPRGGWADTVAARLRRSRPDLEYLNLGEQGRFAKHVRREQLGAALAFEPDLAIVAAGGNDMLPPTFDAAATERELDAMVAALAGAGALVLTVGVFDITRSSLVPEEHREALRERLHRLSALTEEVARRRGALHLGFTSHPASADDAIYSRDRLHLNGRGHAIAAAVTLDVLAAHLATTKEAA